MHLQVAMAEAYFITYQNVQQFRRPYFSEPQGCFEVLDPCSDTLLLENIWIDK